MTFAKIHVMYVTGWDCVFFYSPAKVRLQIKSKIVQGLYGFNTSATFIDFMHFKALKTHYFAKTGPYI